MSFVRDLTEITNPSKHARSLITAESHTAKSTHSGKLQIAEGSQPIFVSALVVPSFKDILISVEQMTKAHKALFTSDGVCIQNKGYPNQSAKLIGGCGSDNIYTIPKENVSGTSSLHATPATLIIPENLLLHNTFKNSNPKTIQDFKRIYSNSAAYILNKLKEETKEIYQSCTPCVLGKAKRKPFSDTKKNMMKHSMRCPQIQRGQ